MFLDIMGAAKNGLRKELHLHGTFIFMAVGYSSVSSETSEGVSTDLTRDWVQVLPI